MKGIIFDIQQYAIYDGPGIRTLVFLKGCPLSCTWCQNPESQNLKPQRSYFREKCSLCGLCVEECPNNALIYSEEEIKYNHKLCSLCGKCLNVCPNDVIQIIGKEVSVDEIISIVSRDKPFFDSSEGGVTISGGEPTMQYDFLIELLSRFKKEGIHTAIETCGYFKTEIIPELTELVDLFLFDIKHPNKEIHKQFTGVDNKLILENFKKIHGIVGSNRITCRIPLIPGINTELDILDEILSFLKQIDYKGSIHLMPYNRLAKTKYKKIGRGKEYIDLGELSEKKLRKIITKIKQNSFEVICNE
ncbi:MAG: glycyl-radical enzyme activating protein [Candidatus Lokiarchaeota archaeon]|nr:glycyl-radical enzyme activating protein [Candidatus Lokiarchaeota archaeon]MBD3201843.1 glycyl-radical enzyme activating protein [Candidatus Lokiarchaeota archaeon]